MSVPKLGTGTILLLLLGELFLFVSFGVFGQHVPFEM
jgi:hypothetical protein